MTRLSAAETYAACHAGVVGRVVPVDAVRLHGPDARTYLQSQLSQDLTGMSAGDSVESLVLSPQGKVEAYVTVVVIADDDLVTVVDGGFGEELVARLKRFKLRVKAELTIEVWNRVELRGPGAASAVSAVAGDSCVVPVEWPGLTGVDVLGPDATLPLGVDEGDTSGFDAVRIEAGMPVMGREVTERSIPQETGLVPRTVSFTKGCYPGQELVARIDARGDNVAKRLRGIVIPAVGQSDAEGLPTDAADVWVGAKLLAEGREVGTITSAAPSPGRGAIVALGYVQRALTPPASATLMVEEGVAEVASVEVDVVELPMGA